MTITVENDQKSEDKKDIEMEEKKTNEDKKTVDKNTASENVITECETGKLKEELKEGIEVKPKKVPIGGIQMPGFFTRSKSKEKCKEGEETACSPIDAEATELLENKEKKDDSLLSQAKIKLPNPFRKSKVVEDDVEKGGEPKEKSFVDTLRKTLVSVIPNKKKDSNLENQTKAGLASMETLDDNDKTADKSDEMKNIPLNDNKVPEKEEDPEPGWKTFFCTNKKVLGGILLFILILIIIICIVTSGNNGSQSAPIKDGKYVSAITFCGPVEGLVDDSAVAFRGIPYARPPIDALRFKAAQPLNDLNYCWNGTFLAHNATDTCIQIHGNGTTSGVEDCLTLDVITPYVRYDNPLPVVVLVGSETFLGGSPGKMRPSARNSRTRDVLYVRPNFRLGVLGFLATEALSGDTHPPTSGNYGLTDLVQALTWIQLNIRHFGGDPRAVILFGHRAGATMVTALATMAGAERLFDRVWATSGGAQYPSVLLSEAETEGESFMKAVDCEDIDCLRAMDPYKLMESVEDTWRKPQPDLPLKSEINGTRHQWLVLDGQLLRESPATVWADDRRNLTVKLVLGTTAHASSTELLRLRHTQWTEELVTSHIRHSALTPLNVTEEALRLYQPQSYIDLTRMISDVRTVCPLYAISTQMRDVPFYVVTATRVRDGEVMADVDSDVDVILGRYEPKTPEQRRYVGELQKLFYDYIWHGKMPGNAGQRGVIVVDQDILYASNYSHCDFWIRKNVVLTYAQLD